VALLETCSLEKELIEFKKTHQLLITERVLEEYRAGTRIFAGIGLVEEIFGTVRTTISERLLPYFHFKSSSGEISIISFAIADSHACCVIDEEFARNVCRLFGLKLTGTVGIIRKMLTEHILDPKAVSIIRSKLKASNFYLTERLLYELR
jgi:predicted nucleic acid-binding protein